jgi:FkbM family methyltransferase
MLIDFKKLFPKHGLKFTGVLHVGANVGEERDTYRDLGIHHQIWIEANPEIFLKLKENISDNPNAVAFNYAIGDYNGSAILNISSNNSQSSSVLELEKHKIEHPDVYYIGTVEVPMARIDSLFGPIGHESDVRFNLKGVDLLNVDVQGYELNVLKGMGETLNQFKALYLEVNKDELYKNCALIEDIDIYVASFGFERVETYWAPNKSWGDALYVKEDGIN